LREFAGRKGQPTAMILDSRTLQSTPESGVRGCYDGTKRRKGSKVHAAVGTLGHLLALHITAADEQDREQVETLAETVQEITGEHIELAYVGQGYTGENAAQAAEKHPVRLEVVKHAAVKRGFVLLPRRWWWGAASPGQRATIWPSSSSCSLIWRRSSRKVNNRLNIHSSAGGTIRVFGMIAPLRPPPQYTQIIARTSMRMPSFQLLPLLKSEITEPRQWREARWSPT
jgi:hypothetical protein